MNVIAFVVSIVLFVGGFFLMGYSFEGHDLQALMFFAGIIVTTLGVVIPIHVLKRIDA